MGALNLTKRPTPAETARKADVKQNSDSNVIVNSNDTNTAGDMEDMCQKLLPVDEFLAQKTIV